MKCIILLEKSGTIIHGIISDGATTNRKLWSEFGIAGKLNDTKCSFIHPLNDNRKFFVFSDAPHLVKNIRNRLFNKKQLKLNHDVLSVKWEHFEILHNNDSLLPAGLGVCSRISKHHICLNSASEMSVSLATQIFSHSMAVGLNFYKNRKTKGLEDSGSTIGFYFKINSMFDAINRRFPTEGLRSNSKDFEWLNDWEDAFTKGCISEKDILSKSTFEELRVTLNSTIQLSKYLLEKCDFKYVLTNKCNQDALERFFGTIRQAGGQNDHPATPTFLQLYKLLSLYSILKAPKYENCVVEDDKPERPLISVSYIKYIFTKEAKQNSLLEVLKQKLDGLVHHEQWESCDIVEHDYMCAQVVDCLIYYVTGYLCRQIMKYTKYDSCKNVFTAPVTYSQYYEAQLVNYKTMGKLIHPNHNFFKLIREVESAFCRFASSTDVYEKTLTYIIDHCYFSFPCRMHKYEVFSYAVNYYIHMRMRQYSFQMNKELDKTNATKKKIAKLVHS
ncbi:hypothetical protein PR048_021271 [Dryococelus australis]|uniref:Transposable element P transposase n=1 Tax=Dryococelus australis TaxID=614101 RepID=A0ABQ9GXU1_9NEOP|nr:hypothetical protein PR048_021271 [Dryococelus australis]